MKWNMLKWPSKKKKKKNHPGGLRDKGDEADPKIFSTRKANCPALFLKKVNSGS